MIQVKCMANLYIYFVHVPILGTFINIFLNSINLHKIIQRFFYVFFSAFVNIVPSAFSAFIRFLENIVQAFCCGSV